MNTAKRRLSCRIVSTILIFLIIICGLFINRSDAYAATDPKLTIRYIDEDGNSLALNEVVTTKGGFYTLSLKVITGYTFKESSMPIVGEITADSTIDLIYKENLLKLVVKFVDEEGNKLQDSKVYSTTLRTLLTLDLRKIGQIEGYTYTGNSQIIDVEIVGGATMELVYRKNKDAENGGGCGGQISPYFLGVLLLAPVAFVIMRKIKLREENR